MPHPLGVPVSDACAQRQSGGIWKRRWRRIVVEASFWRDWRPNMACLKCGAAMERVQDRAEATLRASLRALGDGRYAATELLDDGTPISVRITVEADSATIDFTGTGPVNPGNLNASPAIAMSAVLYVLRLLVREPLPLNEGLLRPITLILPRRHAGQSAHFDPINPAKLPAVVGGNTETSQRIVDTLLKALGLVAGSQGTMNNTLWGNSRFGYYETVCGGAGATATAPWRLRGPYQYDEYADHRCRNHRDPLPCAHRTLLSGGTDREARECTAAATESSAKRSFSNRLPSPCSPSIVPPPPPPPLRAIWSGRRNGSVCRADNASYISDGTVEELSSISGCEVVAGDRA